MPTPWGEESAVVPSGTQTATVLRLKGKGLPRLGQSGRGDLHIRINVWTPERLNSEQERLFRELAEHEGDPPGHGQGLLVPHSRGARLMGWWAVDVLRRGPPPGDALAAWLVARTGQAIEERDDGTLVTFAEDEPAARALVKAIGGSPDRSATLGSGRSTSWTGPPAGATGSPRAGSAG